MPSTILFDYTTVAELAAHLRSSQADLLGRKQQHESRRRSSLFTHAPLVSVPVAGSRRASVALNSPGPALPALSAIVMQSAAVRFADEHGMHAVATGGWPGGGALWAGINDDCPRLIPATRWAVDEHQQGGQARQPARFAAALKGEALVIGAGTQRPSRTCHIERQLAACPSARGSVPCAHHR